MVEIRFIAPCAREFDKDLYRPGIISLSRVVWGSIGTGMFLGIIGVLSHACDVGVLYPPLAATCFIAAACVHLRVARPKAVIVGHFISTVCGILGVHAGDWLVGGTHWAIPVKLGLTTFLAAALMQVLDADHPPAAATAAIPAILPLPASELVLPLHMAWGGVVTVCLAVVWNRFWFECPVPEENCCRTWLGLGMQKADVFGCVICLTAAALMAARPLSEAAYLIGLWLMAGGVAVLSLHHFFDVRLVSGETEPRRQP